MGLGTFYCLKMFGTLYAQNTLNVFFYEQASSGTPSDAEGLFEAFDEDVLNHWTGSVLNQTDIIRVEVFAPSDPSDFFDGVPVNNQGLRAAPAGERSPSYAAFGFRSNRAGPGTRASYKRFCGLAEEDMDANSLQPSFTGLAAVVALQAALGTVISQAPTGALYKPIQVQHPVPLGFPPVKNFDITTWGTAYLTSQVSRRAPAGT